jgi:hypothetical protein
MGESTAKYLEDQMTWRQLEYVRNTWGVALSLTIQVAVNPKGQHVIVGSADVLNLLGRAELNNPPAVILTSRVSEVRDLRKFTAKLIGVWEQSVKDAGDKSAK